jgi:hypothetical protein
MCSAPVSRRSQSDDDSSSDSSTRMRPRFCPPVDHSGTPGSSLASLPVSVALPGSTPPFHPLVAPLLSTVPAALPSPSLYSYDHWKQLRPSAPPRLRPPDTPSFSTFVPQKSTDSTP